NQVPVVTWPADVAVNVDASCTAIGVDLGTATSVDNCDGISPLTYSRTPSGNNFAIGVTNVYWTAWDNQGNQVYHTQTVTVTDNIAPVITCPVTTYFREFKNATVNYYSVIGNEFTPPVSDNCTLTSYINSKTGTQYLNGTQLTIGNHLITWTATDTGGNISTCVVNITIVDSFVPKITCPVDFTQTTDAGSCSYTIGAGVTTYDATSSSVSGSSHTMTHNLVGAPSTTNLAGATIPKGTNTITWTATQTIDGTVYSNTCSFDFVVTDNIAPVMDLPFANVIVNVDPGTCTKTMTLVPPTATDNCSLPENITITSNAPAIFLLGSTNVRWSFTDESGNATIYNQTVTVNDNEGPVITNCPVANITAPASGSNCKAVVSWPPLIATDACSGVKIFTSNYSSGSLFPVGTTVVTYTATDNKDNVSTCAFNVIVTDAPPTITCIGNKTRNTNSGLCSYKVLGNEFDPTAFTDNCATPTITWSFIHPETGLTVTGTNTLSGIDIPRGSDNGVDTGKITITWTATDSNTQTASCSFVLTIEDHEAPVITVPGNQTRSTDLHKNYYTVSSGEFDDVTAIDNCGIVSKLVNEYGLPTLNGLQMHIGENTVTWRAVDDKANASEAVFYAYVVDTELPRLETAPIGITVNTLSGCSSAVSYTPPVIIDNVTLAGNLVTTISPSYAVPGYVFPVGVTPVTYSVVDETGNSFVYSFDVTVVDATPPTITCATVSPFNRDTDLDKANYTTVGTEFDPTSYFDNCSVTLTNNRNSSTTLAGTTFPVGTTSVIWTATDASNNTATCTIQVIVTDNQLPVIATCPDATATKNAEANQCYYLVPGSDYDPFGFSDNVGVQKLTYSINGGAEVGTDLSTTIVGQHIPVGTIANPTTTVLWRLYDIYGNVNNSCTTVFIVSDPEPPTVLTVATQTRSTDAGQPDYTANSTDDISWNPTVTDNCAVQTITYQIDGGTVIGTDLTTTIIGEKFAVGTHTVVWTATDIHGNTNTGTYQVIIEDNEHPIVVCNPLTIQLDATGNYTLSAGNIAVIGLGSTDANGPLTMTVTPDIFDCADAGDNTVLLTVTDAFGNASTCNAIITVQDVTPPTAICKPLTVYLDALGSATILPADMNNGSSDACGITSFTADKTVFDCTNVGTNTVTLTVTDNNGNASTCTSTVTVVDNDNPVAVCKNITVYLNAAGSKTITGQDIDNGSYDNCSSTLIKTATPNTFDCTKIGTNTVTLTVTDPG
ncbi:MAG: HYR domain-containing protein, partial [Sulfuricurvum sp.]|nr:HYR domain-containing protein [Sulfuricurvum sp.]